MTKDDLINEAIYQERKCFLICESFDYALWEYDRRTKLMSHQRKFGGKWSDSDLDIPDFKNTMLGWGIIHPDDLELFIKYCNSLDNGDESFSYELRMITDSGSYTWSRYKGRTLYDEKGNVIKTVGITENLTEKKEEQKSWIDKASRDSLTSLLNKNATKNAIVETIRNSGSDTRHCLAIIDIDDFKYINDTFGHQFGDSVIKEFADTMSAVFPDDIVGRIGGDEFFIMKKNIKSDEEINFFGTTICEAVRSINLKNEKFCTSSVGISVFPDHGINYEQLYYCADNALYETKGNGKNGFTVYHDFIKHDKQALPKRKQAQNRIVEEEHTIDEHIINYAFEVLTKSISVDSKIKMIFDYIGSYYGFTRIFYAFCNDIKSKIEIPFIWSDGLVPNTTAKITERLTWFNSKFKGYATESAVYTINDIQTDKTIAFDEFDAYEDLSVRSLCRINLYNENKYLTFIQFEDKNSVREFGEDIVDTLLIVSKIINIHINGSGKNAQNEKEINNNQINKIFGDMQENFMYVIDPDSYDIIYLNDYARKKCNVMYDSGKCYALLCGSDKPCEQCFAQNGTADYGEVSGVYKIHKNMHIKAKEFILKTTGKKVCAINAVNRSRFMPYNIRINQADGRCMDIDDFIFEADKIIKSDPDTPYAFLYLRMQGYERMLRKYGFTYEQKLMEVFSKADETLGYNEIFSHITAGDFIYLFRVEGDIDSVYSRNTTLMKELLKQLEDKEEKSLYSFRHGFCVKNPSDTMTVRECIDQAYGTMHAREKNVGAENMVYYRALYKEIIDDALALSKDFNSEVVKNRFSLRNCTVKDKNTDKPVYIQTKIFKKSQNDTPVSEDAFSIFLRSEQQINELITMKLNLLGMFIKQHISSKNNTPVSIYISGNEAAHPEFIKNVENAITRYHIPPELLIFEMSSEHMRENTNNFLYCKKNIEELGIRCALSDFSLEDAPTALLELISFEYIKVRCDLFMWFGEYTDIYLKKLRKLHKTAMFKNAHLILSSVEPVGQHILDNLSELNNIALICQDNWE